MRTGIRQAAALATSLLLAGTLAACGLPGGGGPDGCDSEPNDVLAQADTFVTHASSCNNAGGPSDTDWFLRRVPLGGDLRFTCVQPTGVSPIYDLQFSETVGGPVTELGEGECNGTPVVLEDLPPGFLQVIISHGGVISQRADIEVVPTIAVD